MSRRKQPGKTRVVGKAEWKVIRGSHYLIEVSVNEFSPQGISATVASIVERANGTFSAHIYGKVTQAGRIASELQRDDGHATLVLAKKAVEQEFQYREQVVPVLRAIEAPDAGPTDADDGEDG